jgi:hypothetical protein
MTSKEFIHIINSNLWSIHDWARYLDVSNDELCKIILQEEEDVPENIAVKIKSLLYKTNEE